jgi:hypothetical protein
LDAANFDFDNDVTAMVFVQVFFVGEAVRVDGVDDG